MSITNDWAAIALVIGLSVWAVTGAFGVFWLMDNLPWVLLMLAVIVAIPFVGWWWTS